MDSATHGTRKRPAVSEVEELSPAENRRHTEERRRWFKEGRCPACGELGPFVQGAPVCSVHGPYPFVRDPDTEKGMDEHDVEPEEPPDEPAS